MHDEPTTEDRLSIGRFARLTGLSIGALRHYDELDLLRPAHVDRSTGYRSYAHDQVEIGRAIARLRDLEVPLEGIRAVLDADDPAEQRRRVAEQAARVQARVDRQVHILHVLRQLSQQREPLMTDTTATADGLDADTHRRLGKHLYNHAWTLIETPDRTPEQVDEMLAATHASAYHWSKAGGTLANAARGHWQVARVYATLGRGEPALWHARRCVELAEAASEAGVADDWDLAAALEGLARAQAVAGDGAAARATAARARDALATIADPEDRQLIEQDLASLPI
ncbi:MAG TPA: helix-turn-helix domain-containing protein [Candidatus Dormibacteraeota bacterium]|nr:helix-turn-helix domain-containing protein [Candidatus Dormibacteraeota bacterium]